MIPTVDSVLIARRIYRDAVLLDGTITVFSHGMEKEAGVPDLGTMQDFAKALGVEVSHLGYGCFSARSGNHHLFTFDAGGAMRQTDDGFSWSHMSCSPDSFSAFGFNRSVLAHWRNWSQSRMQFVKEVDDEHAAKLAKEVGDRARAEAAEKKRVEDERNALDDKLLAQEHEITGAPFIGADGRMQAWCSCGWRGSLVEKKILATNQGKRHIKSAESDKRLIRYRRNWDVDAAKAGGGA